MVQDVRGWSVPLTGLLAASGIALLALLWGGQSQRLPAQSSSVSSPVGVAGTASCSARGCHGSLLPVADSRILQNEYTTWTNGDPHTNAYRSLLNDRSRGIAKKLGIPAAHEDVRCLACHTTPAALRAETPASRDERFQGIGCESCHGPAERWLEPHVTLSWRQLSPMVKQEQYGLVPLGDLAMRTQTCAGCHIGAPPANGLPGRNMNHDMIAAGHPQLHFEMTSFLANLPRHWRARDDNPNSEAQAWAVGQVASAQAAMQLLAYRARTADQPWPEFAEYDCFACHHALLDDNTGRWRQKRGYGKRLPGALPWGEWYFSMLPALAAQRQPPGASVLPGIDELAKSLSRPSTARARIADLASQRATELQTWIASLQKTKLDHPGLGKLLGGFAQVGDSQIPEWDVAEQLFLALLSYCGPEEARLHEKTLAELMRQRAFPRQQDSPNRDFRSDQFLTELRGLLKRLPP